MKFVPHPSLPIAFAMVLSVGAAFAQTNNAPSAATGTTANSGTSATGGQAAPMAQPRKGTRTNGKETLSRADRKFIQKAAESGLYEVQVAKLAQYRATDPAVKDFARMLVDQHTNANNELTQLANNKHVELPAVPGLKMRHDANSLARRTGADFDQHFVSDVGIKDHEMDIKEFVKAGKEVKDADLKAWVAKTLPTLRVHLAQARKLPDAGMNDASKMGGKGSGTSKKSPG